MTLVIGIKVEDNENPCIVMAGDGRLTDGMTITDNHAEKLRCFGRFCVGASGIQAITDRAFLDLEIHGGLAQCVDVDKAAAFMEEFLSRSHATFFDGDTPNHALMYAAFLLAGFAGDQKTPGIYRLHSGLRFRAQPVFRPAYVGAQYCEPEIELLVRWLYEQEGKPRFTLKTAKEFAILAISEAHSRDVTVGRATQLSVVEPDRCTDASYEIKALEHTANALRQSLRKRFWR